MYLVGPLVSTAARATETEVKQTMMGHEVTHFLDQSLGAHGKHRLVYVGAKFLRNADVSSCPADIVRDNILANRAREDVGSP